MNEAASLAHEAASNRATVAARAGLRVVSLLDNVLEQQPQDSCLALRSLKRTLRAAQLNPLSLIETSVLQMALTQLQIIDDGGDPRVGTLARNLEVYLALRRIKAANDAAERLDEERASWPTELRTRDQVQISGMDMMERTDLTDVSRFQDSPFINHNSAVNSRGFCDTVMDQSLTFQAPHFQKISQRSGVASQSNDGFPDTVQEFPETVPAAFA